MRNEERGTKNSPREQNETEGYGRIRRRKTKRRIDLAKGMTFVSCWPPLILVSVSPGHSCAARRIPTVRAGRLYGLFAPGRVGQGRAEACTIGTVLKTSSYDDAHAQVHARILISVAAGALLAGVAIPATGEGSTWTSARARRERAPSTEARVQVDASAEAEAGPKGLAADLDVIVLSIDSLRADMPWAGYPRPIAPRLTELEKRSVSYTRAYRSRRTRR